MRAKIKDMTAGRPLPLIISFALPLMVGNLLYRTEKGILTQQNAASSAPRSPT